MCERGRLRQKKRCGSVESAEGYKELKHAASENEIAPNRIWKCKSEFIEKAPLIFYVKRDIKLKAEIVQQESEIDVACKEGYNGTRKSDTEKRIVVTPDIVDDVKIGLQRKVSQNGQETIYRRVQS